jgi:hypothetical protein
LYLSEDVALYLDMNGVEDVEDAEEMKDVAGMKDMAGVEDKKGVEDKRGAENAIRAEGMKNGVRKEDKYGEVGLLGVIGSEAKVSNLRFSG